MAPKCALIVDDSRTARKALAAVLSTYQFRVEHAASAEEALEFLGRSRPDVIFMDHNMPGMDGFQAVQAIKANPATATIPIMMYTSQEGELYVGQARALGAIGVLPKQIKPVEVSQVLRSLHLIDSAGDEGPVPAAPAGSPATPAESGMASEINARDWTDLHRWLQEMFEHHAREMRSDIEATISRALRAHAESLAAAPPPVVPPPVAAMPEAAVPPSRASRPTTLLMLALLALAGVFFWLHLDTQRKWRAAVEQNARLTAALTSGRSLASAAATGTARELAAERSRQSGQVAEFLSALEWGANQSAAYPPGTEPFGTQRLESLKGLIGRLEDIGFRGVVRLDSHVGDFCYLDGTGTTTVPAPDDLPAERCDRIGLPPAEARALSAVESVAFANFRAVHAAGSAVRIELVAHGNVLPRAPYPAGVQGLTAGEWNRIAALNQRVDVSLLPDPVGH